MQLVQRVTRWEVKIAVVAELILCQQPQSVSAVGSYAEPRVPSHFRFASGYQGARLDT